MKKIAVIGAGCSGLASIKSLLDEGLFPVCFEITTNVGGLWNYTDDECPDRATVFKGTVSNSSREFLSFSDFPQPAEHPIFMPAWQVARYYKLYSEKFDLQKYIRFQHKVIKVKPTPDHEQSGNWSVRVINLKENREEEFEFEAVLVCSGHHCYPKTPHYPGQERFKGKQLHSHDYRKPNKFEDQNVLVVGFGNSACDIATECSFWAKQVFISTRKKGWISPRIFHPNTPIDCLSFVKSNNLIERFLPQSWNSTNWEKLVNKHFDHESLGLKPDHRIINQYPLINDIIFSQIVNGKVKVVKGLSELTENGVICADGTELNNIDTIIYATGFSRQFPYLEDVFDTQNDIDKIYKYIFPTSLTKNTLAFIGLIDPDVSLIMTAEMQSRWVAHFLSGKTKLPDRNVMEKDAKKSVDDNKALFSTVVVENFIYTIDYIETLGSEIGCKPNLLYLAITDPKLFWACFTGPTLPQMYRLRGPHSWPGARQFILDHAKRMSISKKRDGLIKTVSKTVVFILPIGLATAAWLYDYLPWISNAFQGIKFPLPP